MKYYFILCLILIGNLYAAEHKILVCENGLETLEWVAKLIAAGEESIEMAAPFLGGKVGCRILDAMTKRMDEKRGLHIYLLIYPIFLDQEEKKHIQNLQRLYPDRFHLTETLEISIASPDVAAINNHMKLLVVDEKYFIVGGTNLDDCMCAEGTYTPDRNKARDPLFEHPSGARDSDVVGSGPIAKELRIAYHNLFALWENFQNTRRFDSHPDHFVKQSHYFPIKEKAATIDTFEEAERAFPVEKISMFFSGPMDKPNKIAQEYVRLIENAKKKITIGNLYFNPTKEIMNSLMKAGQRGCYLTYIGNGLHEGITPKYNTLFAWANRLNYVPLFYGRTFSLWQANLASFFTIGRVRVYEYYVRDVLYHKKTMVVDDHILVIGSYNLGLKSTIGDYELIVVVDSEQVAREQMKVFARDIQFSTEITPEMARGWYFDPWISYMGGLQKQFHGFM